MEKGMAAVLRQGATIVARLTSIAPPKTTQAAIPVTTLDSADQFDEYIGGVLNGGELSISGFYESADAGQAALVTAQAAHTLDAYTITFASGLVWSGNCLVIEHGLGPVNKDDALTFSATLKVSGKPTITTAASTGLTTTFFAVTGSTGIIPAPAGNVYEYTVNIATATTTVTITPIATAGVITVDGNVVASGSPSSAIVLGAAGSIKNVNIVVTETGKSPKTYLLHLTRA
jgi:hypothetical protein